MLFVNSSSAVAKKRNNFWLETTKENISIVQYLCHKKVAFINKISGGRVYIKLNDNLVMKRVSKKSRKLYINNRNISDIHTHLNLKGNLLDIVINTSEGLLSIKDCKERNIGGEIVLALYYNVLTDIVSQKSSPLFKRFVKKTGS